MIAAVLVSKVDLAFVDGAAKPGTALARRALASVEDKNVNIGSPASIAAGRKRRWATSPQDLVKVRKIWRRDSSWEELHQLRLPRETFLKGGKVLMLH